VEEREGAADTPIDTQNSKNVAGSAYTARRDWGRCAAGREKHEERGRRWPHMIRKL